MLKSHEFVWLNWQPLLDKDGMKYAPSFMGGDFMQEETRVSKSQ
jgi:hypothetical protein